ncbi:hypothetical protein CFHF_08075 [Caulobacter flavus]|uniref:Nuclear transport factor 2 family protein n=1 Tax=Caulobacter flavus TaxID=1679497 RepID=A0A2N5CVE2_9CAUL|nr:nuclear transport factor 2 family protein [Caulobacter flavus]AYV46866.1 hypothetical protein C1707_11660 [Caulobacter flavus]PLR17774.1 hypothetical protein CFHF_08075 [Caulobacter flavus]
MIAALLAAIVIDGSAPPSSIAAPPAAPAATQALDPAAVKAVEAVAYDYVDGQLEGDVARVVRSLHPDLAKRAVRSRPDPDETLGLRRMNRDELAGLTRQGALKTPREQWDRSVRVLDIAGNVAVARVETPWFVDHLNLGLFGDRWVIVNALWYAKPQPAK